MAKYRKKQVVIEAVQWTGNNKKDIRIFFGIIGDLWHFDNGNIVIGTLEGNMIASKGDYIIKGVKGEFYPCKPDIFKMIYEEV